MRLRITWTTLVRRLVMISGGQPDTAAAPFCTLDYGISRMSGGDTLYVKAGTYQPNGGAGYIIITGPSGTSGTHTTIRAYPGQTPIITGSSSGSGFRVQGASDMDFIGFEISGMGEDISVEGANQISDLLTPWLLARAPQPCQFSAVRKMPTAISVISANPNGTISSTWWDFYLKGSIRDPFVKLSCADMRPKTQSQMGTFHDDWQPAPREIALYPNEVHLWRVDLNSAAAADNSIRSPLSVDEIARAEKFHFERDQQRFARTRVALRIVLSRYVRLRPEDIDFAYQPNGKPELPMSHNQIGLQFNISHSGNVALIGVSSGRRLGVDVERYRTMEFLEIARHYFSVREYGDLTALPAEDLPKNFFACWTRKEALLKASGEGIGSLLNQVSVTVAHCDSPNLLEFQDDPEAPNRWSLSDVHVYHDYAGALVFEHGPVEVRHWIFQ